MAKIRNCPICSSNQTKDLGLVMRSKETHRLRCDRCNLIFFDRTNYPKPKYDLKYNRHFHRPGDIRKAGIMAARIAEIITERSGKNKILEIGPGNGLTSFLLDRMKFNVTAMDNDWRTRCIIKSDLRIRTATGKFEDSQYIPTFDFIYAGHVIEHSEDPVLFFKKAHTALNNNGLFFIDTPDTHYMIKHGLSWKHFNTRDPYEHCNLLSIETVEYLARKTRFHIIKEETLPEFESMQILMRKK